MYDRIKPFIAVGVGIDPTAADDVTGVSATVLSLSNPRQLFDAKYFMSEGLATYEGDGIPTSVSAGMVAPPESPTDGVTTGIWSKNISDASGRIQFHAILPLSRPHSSALSLYFAHEATGTVSFRKDGSLIDSISFVTDGGIWTNDTVRTFDTIDIVVSTIDKAFSHVKLVEVEFGASRTFGEDELTDSISLIRQIDPFMASVPVDELDFSIININGDFDIDNPQTRIGEIALGTPVYLSFTTEEDGVQTTTRMGKYFICAHDGADDTLRVTAQDARSIMQDIYPSLALSTSRPIAESISDVLGQFNIQHTIDDSARGIYPNANYVFDKRYSLLDSLLYILQKWDIFIMPDTEGMMRIQSYSATISPNAPIPEDYLLNYPQISKNVAYNFVRVGHDTGHIDRDLRPNPQSPMLMLNVDNPLINTEAEARTLADKMAGYVLANAEQMEVSAIGIPTLGLRGGADIKGRWATRDYSISSIDMTFDGGLEMTVRGGRA